MAHVGYSILASFMLQICSHCVEQPSWTHTRATRAGNLPRCYCQKGDNDGTDRIKHGWPCSMFPPHRSQIAHMGNHFLHRKCLHQEGFRANNCAQQETRELHSSNAPPSRAEIPIPARTDSKGRVFHLICMWVYRSLPQG
jgi:hypothetical protein